MDKLIPFADSITVSNTFLQKKFGGVLVPHFRDTDAFDPAKFDRDAIRERLDVADKKVVMFMGTIRAHKGIDTLVRAFDELGRDDVVLMLVGVSDEAKHALPRRPYLRVFGFQPFEKVPEFLEAADMVALMQKSGTSSAQGQLPAKLFDAMSMAKPILATRVSDIPAILDGCGVVLNDTPSDLAAAIRSVLDNPEAAAAMGAAARRRCVEEYSYRAMRPRLSAVFADLAGDSAPSR